MDNTARIIDGEIIPSSLDDYRLYSGVRTRRIFAWLIDYLMIGLLTIPFAILVFLLGVLTLGLGWMLFSFLVPAVAAAGPVGASMRAAFRQRLSRQSILPSDPSNSAEQ